MNKNYTYQSKFKVATSLCFLIASISTVFSQNDDFDRIQKIVASDRTAGNQFGYSVSISGDYAAVGAALNDTDANNLNPLQGAGAVYILERNAGGFWEHVVKITQPIRAIDDRFGSDVKISGTKLVVGSVEENDDVNELNPLNNSGAAFIFERDGSGNWNFVQKITASIRANSDLFGSSVGISNNRIIIGSPLNDTDASNLNPINNAGAVYTFEKNGLGIWTQVQKLVANDRADSDNFGTSCSISDNFFVVGSPFNNTDVANLNSLDNSGAAYVYSWNVSSITLFQKIVANDRKLYAQFGIRSVIEGSIIAVSAIGETSDEDNLNPLINAGAVYTYNLLVSPLPAFYFYEKLTAPDRDAYNNFGNGLDISGSYIIVGSYNSYDNTLTNSNFISYAGSAYVFKKTISYDFFEKLTAKTRSANEEFGTLVAITTNSNGMEALVNCKYDSDDENDENPLPYAGSATFFGTCFHSSSTLTASGCNYYDFNETRYLNSGTYIDTIPNAMGCDSIVTINLSISIVDTTLSYINGFVNSNQGNATYQWINCQTGLAVPGETNQVLDAPVNGIYKVIIYPIGASCSDTSACVFINNVGIEEFQQAQFSVFPNPSSKEITIKGDLHIYSFILQSLNGEIVEEADLSNAFVQSHLLDVSNLSKGIYFLKITGENSKTVIIKISIQ